MSSTAPTLVVALADLERTIARLVDQRVDALLAARGVGPDVEYITVPAYAAMRSIAVSTAWTAVRDGRLPVKRIGRSVRVHRDAEIAPRRTGRDESAEARAMRIARGEK